MLRALFLAALGVAATVGTARAGDDAVPLGRYQPKTGGITAGVPAGSPTTPADADDDTDLVHWRRGYYGGYYGGYRGYYGGYYGGYRGYYGGYYGGYARPFYGYGYGYGYASFYRPGFAVSYYSAPAYYYAPPVYAFPNYGFSYYGYFPIAGGSAPAVTLSLPSASRPAAPAPRADTFQYDGGPAKPLPAPQPEPAAPQRIEPAQDGTLSIKFTPKPAAKPVYGFKAFGEK